MNVRKTVVSLFTVFGLFAVVDSALGQGGKWVGQTPLPTSRTELAVVAVGTNIFAIGGFTSATVTARVEVYDTVSQRWHKAKSVPRPLHHAAAGVIAGKIYIVGGFTGIFWRPVRSLYVYDLAADEWSTRRPMPTARGALAVAVHDDKLYAIAGLDGARNLAAVERYDPKTDQWQKLAPLPTPRDHLGAAVINDVIHVVGGRLKGSYANNLATHEAYLIADDRWVRREPLPVPRSGIAVASYRNRLFVFGGEGSNGTFNLNQVYDPRLKRWGSLTPMPTARHGLGAARVGGAIYVIGGGPVPGGSYGDRNEAFYLP